MMGAHFRRRNPLDVISGWRFPLVLFVVWRVTHAALNESFGGDWLDDAFQWDGGAYRRIFNDGYENPSEVKPITAFFPLVAWMAKAPALVFSDRTAMLLTANFFALTAFLAVFGAAWTWQNERVARWTLVVLALFPTSVFLWAFYTEASFVTLSAVALAAVHRRRHVAAAVAAGLLAATRAPGIALAGILVIWRTMRTRKVDVRAAVYALGGAAGLGAVIAAQAIQADEPFGFIGAQEDWNRRLAGPWVAMRDGLGIFRTIPLEVAGARVSDLFALAMVGTALTLMAVWKRDIVPPEAVAFGAVIAGLPLFTSILSSYSRFALTVWPAFVGVGWALDRAPRWARFALLVPMAGLSVWLTRMWAHGTFTG